MALPDTTRPPVLIVDDDPDVRLSLGMLLRGEGVASIEAASPGQACEIAAREPLSCVLVDMNFAADTTSGHEGLELVGRLGELAPGVPLVVMTAWASIDLAVQAMQRGAADFVEKPWARPRLLRSVWTQLQMYDMREENRRLRAENALARGQPAALCVAVSPAMRRVHALVERLAHGSAHVLLVGENGTGKSLLARELHARSARADGPLIRVDMGSLPEARFDATLFGGEGGTLPGSFELAHQGSLVLEEVSTIPLHQQAKLLRVLEEGELERGGTGQLRRVDVRVLSTTNADLGAIARTGRFRLDLLYRLDAMQVRLPPLRERRDDIAPLAQHFLLGHCRRLGRDPTRFTPSAVAALRAHHWPGNIRELEHVVEHAVLTATGNDIDADALAVRRTDAALVLDHLTLPEAEQLLVQQAMERHGNLQQAAEALGISRQALYRRLGKQRGKSSAGGAE
ncbi:sigma-54-dependent transcriptional regulator [Luteibacter yeojuensis]|nr:sigma-54 dependent transcriptional regulator [Luteibacter yeojuensis]